MSLLSVFRLIAPEFKESSDETIQGWLDLTAPLVSQKKFGVCYDQAVCFLAAHKMKITGQGDNSNGKIDDMLRIASYSEGEISINYASSPVVQESPDSEYALTVYGLQYLSLKRKHIMTILSSCENR